MKSLAPTMLTTCGGKPIDLLAPYAGDIDFAVIAEHLAKANRYCGATPRKVYSVAEHSVRATDAAWAETRNKTLCAYILCHDMHEAFLGDDTTPKKRALAAICTLFGALSGVIEQAFNEMTDRFDQAIHEAAGLAWPAPQYIADRVKYWDRVMLATEWRDLMGCPPPYEFTVPVLEAKIAPWTWRRAERLFKRRCEKLLPGFRPNDDRRGEARGDLSPEKNQP